MGIARGRTSPPAGQPLNPTRANAQAHRAVVPLTSGWAKIEQAPGHRSAADRPVLRALTASGGQQCHHWHRR